MGLISSDQATVSCAVTGRAPLGKEVRRLREGIALANKTRRSRVLWCKGRRPTLEGDTLTKAAMSSLKIVAGAVLTGTMPVLLWAR